MGLQKGAYIQGELYTGGGGLYSEVYGMYGFHDFQCIDRFHSRDRWPQWGGETIRNI